jgi:hypothetical protein
VRRENLFMGCGVLLMLSSACSVFSSESQPSADTANKNITEIADTQSTAAIPVSSTPTPIPTNTPRILPPTYTPKPTTRPAATRLPVTELPLSYYYVLVRANLRPCPRTTDECAPVVELAEGDSVLVVGQITGQTISRNDIWYQVSYRGQTLYAHSSVLSDRSPSAPEPFGANSGGQTPAPTTVPVDPFGCNGINDLDCSDFNRLGLDANAHLALCGDEDNLDGDGDGRACEDW